MYDKKQLVSGRLDIRPDAKRSFLEDFAVLDDGQRFTAVSKTAYPHRCPDGMTRRFKYAVIGHDSDATGAEVIGLDGDVVWADSLEFKLVPAKEDVTEEIIRGICETCGLDRLPAGREEETFAAGDTADECILLDLIKYPAITLDDMRGSYESPQGHEVLWPLEILDDFASCVPWFEKQFDWIMDLTDNLHGTKWNRIRWFFSKYLRPLNTTGELGAAINVSQPYLSITEYENGHLEAGISNESHSDEMPFHTVAADWADLSDQLARKRNYLLPPKDAFSFVTSCGSRHAYAAIET